MDTCFPSSLFARLSEIVHNFVFWYDSRTKKALYQATKAPANNPGNDENGGPGSPVCKNKGKLLVDATCTPADITFPTDLKILNTAREKSEEFIDILHHPLKGKKSKSRIYRKKARKEMISDIRN